jgi:hypothetical protein
MKITSPDGADGQLDRKRSSSPLFENVLRKFLKVNHFYFFNARIFPFRPKNNGDRFDFHPTESLPISGPFLIHPVSTSNRLKAGKVRSDFTEHFHVKPPPSDPYSDQIHRTRLPSPQTSC